MSKKPITLNPWLIWFPAALFYCYQFILRVSPSVMTDDLMRDFAIGACEFGSLTAFYYYGYCALQIPLGLLADYFGPRKLLTFAALLCAGATALFASSSNIHIAQFGRLLIGVGSSCAFLGCIKLGTIWFDIKHLSIVTGATMLLGTMGANFGGAPLRILIDHYDWRVSLLIVAGFGALIGAAIWILAKDGKREEKDESPIFQGLKVALKTPQVWLGSIYGFFLYTVLSVFADLWGTSFLVKSYNIPTKDAAFYVNFIYLGLSIGALLYAWIIQKMFTMITALKMTTVLVGISFSIVILIPDLPLSTTCALLFITGLFFGGQSLSFAFTCSHMPIKFSGVTIGLTNMFTMLSGLLFQPLIGQILDSRWKGEMIDGVRVFQVEDYRIALFLIPVFIFISFVISIFFKDAKNQDLESK